MTKSIKLTVCAGLFYFVITLISAHASNNTKIWGDILKILFYVAEKVGKKDFSMF